MTCFATYILEAISAEIQSEVSPVEPKYIVTGIEREYLQLALEALEGQPLEVELGSKNSELPFFLLVNDDDEGWEVWNSKASRSGVYSESQCTKARNRLSSFVIACPVGVVAQKGLKGTGLELSMVLDRIKDQWLNTLFESDPDHCLKIKNLVRRIAKHGEPDSRQVDQNEWRLYRRLIERFPSNCEWHDGLLAWLGCVACKEQEMGEGLHLTILSKVAKEAARDGFEAMFVALLETDLASKEEAVAKALREFKLHIEVSTGDAARWEDAVYRGYCPLVGELQEPSSAGEELGKEAPVVPEWWFVLTLDRWDQLYKELKPGKSVGLKVVLDYASEKIEENGRMIVPSSEGLVVSVDESQGLVEGEVKWEMLIGTQWTQLSGSSSKLEQPEITNQKRPVKFKARLNDKTAVSQEVVCLDVFEPGIFVVVVGANNVKFPVRNREDLLEQEIELPQEGRYEAIICFPKGTEIKSVIGESLSPDAEGEKESVEHWSRSEGVSEGFELISDDECKYVIEFLKPCGAPGLLRLKVEAHSEGAAPEKTFFNMLRVKHVSRKLNSHIPVTSSRNDCAANALQSHFLDDKESYFPVLLSRGAENFRAWDDFQSFKGALLGDGKLEQVDDPRPKATEWNPPGGLIKARGEVLDILSGNKEVEDKIVEAISLSRVFATREAAGVLQRYITLYREWYKEAPLDASWFDSHPYHQASGSDNLAPTPAGILLSPLHPLRLGWQVAAQKIMQESITTGNLVPGARLLDPCAAPAQLAVYLRSSEDSKVYASVFNASMYWGVLWERDKIDTFNEDDFVAEFLGLPQPGGSGTVSSGQVGVILQEAIQLSPVRSDLRVSIEGKRGSNEVTTGLLQWFRDQWSEEPGDWGKVSPRRLEVYDYCENPLAPRESELAVHVEGSRGKIKWYVRGSDDVARKDKKQDVAILADLKPGPPTVLKTRGASAVSPGGLACFPLTWHKGAGVSTIQFNTTDFLPVIEQSVLSEALQAVAEHVRECSSKNARRQSLPMNRIRSGLDNAIFCGLSSVEVDSSLLSAALQDGSDDPQGGGGVVWTYSLPELSARSGKVGGHYVLGDRSTQVYQRMADVIQALDPASTVFGNPVISPLLGEFGRRGMDSLRHLASGQAKSLGNLGAVVALRILQPLTAATGIVPEFAGNGKDAVFVVPLDPFERRFDQLRKALPGEFSAVLPDLLSISFFDRDDGQLKIRLTPIEVKCRTGNMPVVERRSTLSNQCRGFVRFLRSLTEESKVNVLWQIWWAYQLCELVVLGAKTRATCKESEWSEDPDAVLAQLSVLTEKIMANQWEIEVDDYGRLVVVDDSEESKLLHQDADIDSECFKETLQVSRADAIRILRGENASEVVPIPKDNWGLLANVHESPVDEETVDEGVVDEGVVDEGVVDEGVVDEGVVDEGVVDEGVVDEGVVDEGVVDEGVVDEGVVDEGVVDEGVVDEGVVDEGVVDEGVVDEETGDEGVPLVRLGRSLQGDVIYWDPFRENAPLTNGHGLIVGTSGSGKTYTIKEVLASQFSEAGIPQLYIDYNDDYTSSEFTGKHNAILLEAHAGIDLNPLVPIPLDPQTGEVNIALHVYGLGGAIAKVFGLGHQQDASFKKALFDLYAAHGIQQTAVLKKEDLGSGDASWPTFMELLEYLEALGDQKLINRVSPLFHLQVFRGRSGTLSDILSRPTVLKLSAITDPRTQNAVADLFLRGVYQTLLRQGHCNGVRLAVFVDEAHKVANLESTRTLLKEARKYGASIWLSSQEPSDFDDSVIANCATFIGMKTEFDKHAAAVGKMLGDSELKEQIRTLKRGEAFIRNGHYEPYDRVNIEKPPGSPSSQ